MSGGHFDYVNYRLDDIADSINAQIKENQESKDHYQERYPEAVVARLQRTALECRRVSRMLKHADYLFSGDDGTESFLEHWKEAGEFQKL